MWAQGAGVRGREPHMKVLVVEDDPDVADLVVLALERAGFELWTETDGTAGLAHALQQRPDVVILDWVMPGMTGVEVCRALRADPRTERTAILLLTSRTQEADID